MITHYDCVELASRPDIYGQFACKQWAVQESLLDTLAITPVQAGQISVAIISVLIIGWIFGQIGSFILSMVK